MWTVSTYVLRQKLAGRKQYPLVLMLEPLFRCNLACAGCGKIQYPAHILKKDLTPEECFRAVDECGAPMVSIPGGEPLMHPQIGEIVEGLVARKKYIYLCTNALLLKEKIHLFKPSKYLTFSVHLDGQREEHDLAVCREGGYDIAVDAIKEALSRGFRVTTNTTLFDGADPKSVRAFFDDMMELGLEGMMLSPGYSYDKAPDQKHFLGRARTRRMFRAILSNRKKNWRFNLSPLFLEFLMGKRTYPCTPWGMPTYNVFGWQKPCYLLQDGYAETFAELLATTELEQLRHRVRQPGLRQLHGPQRLRSLRGERHLQLARRIPGHSKSYACSRAIATKKRCACWTNRRLRFIRWSRSQPTNESLQDNPRVIVLEAMTGKESGHIDHEAAQAVPHAAANPDALEVAPGTAHEKLEGWIPQLATDEEIRAALEKAFDYRGDVTITRKDGTKIEGYLFDRRTAATLKDSVVRLFPKTANEKISISYADIAALAFTGRDTAAGKSWEAWMKKYAAEKSRRRNQHRPRTRTLGLIHKDLSLRAQPGVNATASRGIYFS